MPTEIHDFRRFFSNGITFGPLMLGVCVGLRIRSREGRSVTLAHCFALIFKSACPSGGNRSRAPQPLVHLIMFYHAGLLGHQAAAGENRKVRDAANIEARRECRIFLGIDFQHHSFARHFRRSASHFGSSHAARSAPVCPEIDKHRNGYTLNDFIEQDFVDRQGLGERRQWRFTFSATAGAGQVFRWNTVVLAAMATGANYRQERPPSRESTPLLRCLGSFGSLQQ
jgi:hypothetical protein